MVGDEMGEAFRTHERDGEMYTEFYLEDLKVRGHLKDIDIDRKIILNGFKKNLYECVECIRVTLDRD
jgi:hypothetical protein